MRATLQVLTDSKSPYGSEMPVAFVEDENKDCVSAHQVVFPEHRGDALCVTAVAVTCIDTGRCFTAALTVPITLCDGRTLHFPERAIFLKQGFDHA